jgi:hypothetical protein
LNIFINKSEIFINRMIRVRRLSVFSSMEVGARQVWTDQLLAEVQISKTVERKDKKLRSVENFLS